jgi:hypothetical protein
MLSVIQPIKSFAKEIVSIANEEKTNENNQKIVDLSLSLISSWQFNLMLELPVNLSMHNNLVESNKILLEQITRVQETNTKLLLENRDLKEKYTQRFMAI